MEYGAVPQPLDFTPGVPLCNSRVALLLGSASMPVLSMLSRDAIIFVLAMVVAMYLLDMLNYRRSTIAVLWATIAAAWAVILNQTIRPSYHHPFHEVVFNLNMTMYLAMYGVWGCVQCLWLQAGYPELAYFLERVLLSVTPFTVIPLIYTTVVAFVGVRMTPFAMSVVTVVIHHFCFCGVRSTWGARLAVQRDEAAVFTGMTLFGPLTIYLTSYHRILALNHYHLVNVMFFFCWPGVYFLWNTKRTLWFLSPPEDADSEATTPAMFNPVPTTSPVWAYRRIISVVCAIGCVHWFASRLLMSRYGHLLLGIPPPLNEIVLNIVGGLVVVCAYLAHHLLRRRRAKGWRNAIRWLIILFCSVAASVLLAIVAGMPRFFYPLSSLCAASLTAYLLDRRNINNFMLFSCGTTLTLVWWMFRTFAFLRHELNVIGNSFTVSLQGLFMMIIWCYLCCCATFCLAFSPKTRKGPFMVTMYVLANFVHWIEHVLYSQPEESVYPPYLVFLTTFLGVKMCVNLYQSGVLGPTCFALVSSVYVSKVTFYLACVTADPARYGSSDNAKMELGRELVALWWSSVFACCVLFILFLEKHQKLARVHPGIHYVYSIFAMFVALSARNNIVAFLTAGTVPPTVAASVGSVLLMWSLLLIPIIYFFAPQHNCIYLWRRLHIFLIAVSVLLMYLFSSHSAMSILDSDNDALALRQAWWAPMAGMVFALGFVSTLLEIAPFAGHSYGVVRLGWWAVLGTVGGMAYSGMYLPYLEWHCVLCMCIAFVLFGFTLDICHYTLGGGESGQGTYEHISWWAYGASIGSMIFTFYLVGRVDVSKMTGNVLYMWEIHTASRSSLLALCAAMNLTLAILLKRLVSGAPLLPGVNMRTVMHNQKHLDAVALVGNYCTVLGLVSLYLLNFWMFGYQSTNSDAILYMFGGSLLLLLHDDGLLFTDLSKGSNRFMLPIMASTFSLYFSSYYGSYLSGSVLGIVLTSLTIPSHFYHLRGIATNGKWQPRGVLRVLLIILDIICMVFSKGPSGFWVAILALLLHAVDLYTSKLFQAWHFEGML